MDIDYLVALIHNKNNCDIKRCHGCCHCCLSAADDGGREVTKLLPIVRWPPVTINPLLLLLLHLWAEVHGRHASWWSHFSIQLINHWCCNCTKSTFHIFVLNFFTHSPAARSLTCSIVEGLPADRASAGWWRLVDIKNKNSYKLCARRGVAAWWHGARQRSSGAASTTSAAGAAETKQRGKKRRKTSPAKWCITNMRKR